jgi:hypothetical protein
MSARQPALGRRECQEQRDRHTGRPRGAPDSLAALRRYSGGFAGADRTPAGIWRGEHDSEPS